MENTASGTPPPYVSQPAIDPAKIVDRVKLVLTKPSECWDTLASEQVTPKELTVGFIAPLAVAGALAGFIGMVFVGVTLPVVGTYRAPFFGTLISQIVAVAVAIASVYIFTLLVEQLAPHFGGSTDNRRAFSLVTHSMVPRFCAGLLMFWPWLGTFGGFVLMLYGLYIYHQGVPKMVGVPAEKHLLFTIASVIAMIIAGLVIGLILIVVTPKPDMGPAFEMQQQIMQHYQPPPGQQ